MSILEDLNLLLATKGVPVETGIFSDEAPESYVVITPLSDTFDLHADNAPGVDILDTFTSSSTPSSLPYGAEKQNRPSAPAGGFHDNRQDVQRI